MVDLHRFCTFYGWTIIQNLVKNGLATCVQHIHSIFRFPTGFFGISDICRFPFCSHSRIQCSFFVDSVLGEFLSLDVRLERSFSNSVGRTYSEVWMGFWHLTICICFCSWLTDRAMVWKQLYPVFTRRSPGPRCVHWISNAVGPLVFSCFIFYFNIAPVLTCSYLSYVEVDELFNPFILLCF